MDGFARRVAQSFAWSDGHNTLEEIAAFMDGLGLEYWAITDHSKSSFQANGLDAKRLREQIKEIKTINERFVRRAAISGC